jgi:hypothetical protein
MQAHGAVRSERNKGNQGKVESAGNTYFLIPGVNSNIKSLSLLFFYSCLGEERSLFEFEVLTLRERENYKLASGFRAVASACSFSSLLFPYGMLNHL